MDAFLIKALLAGIGVAVIAGPLGSVVVWRRMAFFGDALAHSALLGIAMALLLSINPLAGVIILALLFSLLLVYLQRQQSFSTDTLLGIMAHSSLAVGLVVVSLMHDVRINLMGLLFGDILATDAQDIGWIYVGAAVGLAILIRIWRPLLLSTINQDLAQVEGVSIDRIRLQFMILIALLVALSIKIVGVMLITALLVIPAAAARQFSQTPERMAVVAAIIGMIAVVVGLSASLQWDTPAGPSIVVAAVLLFTLSMVAGRKVQG